MRHDREYYIKEMNTLGRIFFYAKMIRCWKDGDAVSFIWRWYNPLSWICAPLLAVLVFVCGGIQEFRDNHYLYGFGMSDYWRLHKDEREFL